MIGTQEIVILMTLGIPLIAVYLLVRFFVQQRQQNRNAAATHTAAEIEKLFAFKEKVVITQQEFDNRKSLLLHQ